MEAQVLLIAAIVAGLVWYTMTSFVVIVDRNAGVKLAKADLVADKNSGGFFEMVGKPVQGLIPKMIKNIERDLYWAAFASDTWKGRTPAWVLGRQILMGVGIGIGLYLFMENILFLPAGIYIGWTSMGGDLSAFSSRIRGRIMKELPEILQLMAAESASGASLDTVMARVSEAEGYVPAWIKMVIGISHGKSLFTSSQTGEGILLQEAFRSGDTNLISFAVQLGFAAKGTQVREALITLATQFKNNYVGQAEMRAEQLSTKLGILTAVFYFLPFLVLILLIVGLPVASAF